MGGEKKGNKCVDPDCGPPVKTRNAPKKKIDGVWRCSKAVRHTRGFWAIKSTSLFIPQCQKCNSNLRFHTEDCAGKKKQCDPDCDSSNRRRLADTFPDCSVCEGSGKTRSWFLRQPCENCFGIGKVRD